MKKIFFIGIFLVLLSFFGKANASTCPFTKELSKGVTHQEIAELQRFLSNDSSIYPEKIVSGYYGALTVNAVKRFQEKAGLLESGNVDLATIGALCVVFDQFVSQTGGYSEPAKVTAGTTTTPAKTTNTQSSSFSVGSSCPFDRELSLGSKGNAVTELQKFLSVDNTIYPEKIVSGYYGNLTVNAIKRFQEKAGLLQSGKVDVATATILCQMYLSYRTTETISVDSSFAKNSCVFQTVNLGPGYFESANSEVSNIQKYLNQKGFYPENIVSGFYGQLTASAVKRLQKHYNLEQTGIVDSKTINAVCGSSDSGVFQNGLADLAISNIEADPAQVDVDVPVKIKISHKNIGVIDSSKHKVSLFVNEEEVAYKSNVSLKVNQEINSIDHVWTCKAKGIYIFKVFVDSQNDITETNKYNNVIVFPVNCGGVTQDLKYACNTTTQSCSVSPMGTMTLDECNSACNKDNADLPDLTVASISPTKIKIGEKVKLEIIEKNIGKTTASSHSYKIDFTYRGQTQSLDGVLGALAAGKEQEISGDWTCESAGIYKINVALDTKNEVKESNESNNQKEVTVQCADKDGNVPQDPKDDTTDKEKEDTKKDPPQEKENPPASGKPDLIVWFTDLSGKTTLTKLDKGETSIHLSVKNNSSAAVSSKFKMSLEMETCEGKKSLEGFPYEFPSIGANQEGKISGEGWKVACNYESPWKLTAFIDSENKISELYENNNAAVLSCGELKCNSGGGGEDTKVKTYSVPDDKNDIKMSCVVDGKPLQVTGGGSGIGGVNNDGTWSMCVGPKISIPDNVAKSCKDGFAYNVSLGDSVRSSWTSSGNDDIENWGSCTLPVKDSETIRVVYSVRAICKSDQKIYGTTKCEQTFKHSSSTGDQPINPQTKTRWACNMSTGKCAISSTGNFVTEGECTSKCFSYTPTPTNTKPVIASRYKCVSGKCSVTTETGSNTYASESICKNNCYTYVAPLPSTPISPPVTAAKRYKCSNSQCVVTSETGANTYSTEDACKKVCGYSFTNPAPPSFWELFGSGW